jgi:hypothetical protein
MIAAVLAAVAQTGSSPMLGVGIILGLLLDILKWGVAIWSGYRSYRYLTRKLVNGEGTRELVSWAMG